MRSAVDGARRLDWPTLLAAAFLLAVADWQGASAPPADGVAPRLAQRAGLRSGATSATTNAFESILERRRDHFALLGVDRVHAAGQRGRGARIAILDTGFRGYRDFLGSGLPAKVSVRSFRQDRDLEARDSQHGILCAEIIHALAPEAELFFANWEPEDPEAFLAAVAWAKSCGARVISCSIIIPHWSDGEGGGRVHHALEQLIGEGSGPRDLVFCASAGNIAQRHWAGPLFADRHGLHEWSPGKTLNGLTPWGTERVAVELCGAGANYEVQVFERSSGNLIGKGRPDPQDSAGLGHAVVRFDPVAGETYAVRVSCLGGRSPVPTKMHLTVLGANLEHYTAGGSIPFPGDGVSVLTIGAVDEEHKRVRYSSCGPNSRRPKPDLMARVPFPSLCRDRPFTGTSAAAPQAAALAGLLQARHADWSAGQVRDALRAAALDLHVPGHDCETGYGLVRLR